MTEMKRKPILIPIDHGYGNVKTSNFIFPAGITEYKDEPAMATDTLCWAGRWYAIGDTHKEFIADKTADEDYLKLTMAAIAKSENRRRVKSHGCRSDAAYLRRIRAIRGFCRRKTEAPASYPVHWAG